LEGEEARQCGRPGHGDLWQGTRNATGVARRHAPGRKANVGMREWEFGKSSTLAIGTELEIQNHPALFADWFGEAAGCKSKIAKNTKNEVFNKAGGDAPKV
jgi:hypothetical protein